MIEAYFLHHRSFGGIPSWIVLLGALSLRGAVGGNEAETLSASGTNLIRNPSMEVDADGDGRPDAWRTSAQVEYHRPPRLGKTSWTLGRSREAHTGEWSFHYSAAVVSPPPILREDWWDYSAWRRRRTAVPQTWAVPLISNRFPVIGEREYFFRMWIRARGVRTLHVKYIGHYKGHPARKTYWTQPLLRSPEGVTHVNGSWDWKPFGTRLFVPGGQDWGRLEVWLWQDGQPCEIWVDDVEVRLLPPADSARKRSE
ncbi:MAG: hypothetical protein GXP31_16440 [Kiritimatiellaeota bacterium]|nr:hypothetical protein [Kiritimatiellota bacterium]